MLRKIILLILMSCSFSKVYSHNSDLLSSKKHFLTVTDTTYKCTVITSSSKIYEGVYLCGMTDSSVRVFNSDISRILLIKDIRSIKFNARGFWTGAAVGGGIGFGIGAVIGAQGVNFGSDGGNHNGSIQEAAGFGFIMGIPFALIGGGLGALFASDHFYYLSNINYEGKRDMVKYLIKEYSDK